MIIFPPEKIMARLLVAVHVGAGFHSEANSKELKALCKEACKQSMEALVGGASSSDATALAIAVLENSIHTNAALGSNLSLTGSVECDASIMDGCGNFGAVGAVSGVVNPILLARALLQESCHGFLSLGRVPPLVLVGEGANMWAKQHQIATCSHDDLITDRARAVYLDHMARLEGVSQEVALNGSISGRLGDGLVSHRRTGTKDSSRQRDVEVCRTPKKPRLVSDEGDSSTTTTPYPDHTPLDTVGAICLDMHGHAAAGVSSGGISLKSPGRVGQAAMFSCGCWAENDVFDTGQVVACSTSGTGEYIIKTTLAKECALAMAESSMQKALDLRFLRSKMLRGVDQKLAGAIALHLDTEGILHFSWGHTTESMCIGYMVDNHKEPVTIISKMESPHKSGLVSHVEAVRLH